MPEVKIGPRREVADRAEYVVEVTYRFDADIPDHVSKITVQGNSGKGYPGPVFARIAGADFHVEDPTRFGDTFNEDWIRACYSDSREER